VFDLGAMLNIVQGGLEMPLKEYGVLKGSVIDKRFASGANPHYQLHIVDTPRITASR